MTVPYYELPASAYPFTIRLFDADTQELLDTLTVTKPGAVKIPGYHPRRVSIEIEYADGQRITEGPPA